MSTSVLSLKKIRKTVSVAVRIAKSLWPTPLSSRVHAKVVWLRNSWVLKDCGSRNGTIVNGNKVDELELVDSFRIRIGNTELRFTDESVRDIATEDAPFTPKLSSKILR